MICFLKFWVSILVQVIWLENVEVNEHQVQENIYSSVVNSNLAFCAKRCVRTLLQKLKRNNSRFLNLRMPVDQQGMTFIIYPSITFTC